MPRKSAASLTVVPLDVTGKRTALSPVGLQLTRDELTYFNFVARNCNHLTQLDVPNLMLYACAVVRAMKSRNRDDGEFEKQTRLALTAARSLRLTPQACMQGVSANRAREQPALYHRPWDRHPERHPDDRGDDD
jgi:hypothetical protein